MKKIGFKNFRKFENFPTIALGDVTYLVGQNNAGKSTLVKAAILMLENLRQKSTIPLCDEAFFTFVSPVHDLHVETFARALRRNSEEKKIHFTASLSDFDFEITVVPADDEVLYSHIQKENDRNAPIDYFLVRDNKLGVTLEIYPFVNKYVLTISGDSDIADNQNDTLIADINQRLSALRTAKEIVSDIKEQVSINNEIDALEKKLVILAKKKQVSNDEQLIFNSLHLAYPSGSEAMFSIAREVSALAYMAGYDDALKQSRLSSLTLGLSEFEKKQQGQYLSKMRKHANALNRMAVRLNAVLYSIDVMYIQAHLASQDMVLNAHSNDVFAKEVDVYEHKTKIFDRDKSIYRFVQKWMDADHFNIGKGFEVEEKLPGYYTLTIDTYENGPVPVGDMGMGTNQLMILLLHIANEMFNVKSKPPKPVGLGLTGAWSTPLVFIEEPEQNLHPNLQSKLADFFYELATSKECPIQFVVETHSEYIIRNSQYIVAKQKYKDEQDLSHNPQKVYFFPLDKPVYDMHYNPNGTFEESFAPGFYDMASDLTMDTLMLSM